MARDFPAHEDFALFISRRAPLRNHLWIPSFTAASLLALYGCDAATEAPASKTASVTSRAAVTGSYSGKVDTSNGRYTFTPTTCVMYQDGEVLDIEVGGPGSAPDGEKIFVEFSSTANELSIGLGVDTAFASSDRTMKAGEFVSKRMRLDVEGKTIRVSELDLVDQSGNHQTGSLEINC